MTFFNKKEDVMKIELTPYGRYLLSVGKLEPHSYRFFDENVIYDAEPLGINERQNKIHYRIKNETPLVKCNPNITGVETNIRKFETPEVYAKHIRTPTLDDTISSNNESVGTNSFTSKNASYYKVDMFNSNFVKDKITKTYSSKNVGNVPIPQLPINYALTASIVDSEGELEREGEILGITYTESQVFPDNKKIEVSFQEPLLRIKEVNGFDEKENFILTAYKVKKIDGIITYSRLKFPKKPKKIVNNILLDYVPASDAVEAMDMMDLDYDASVLDIKNDRIDYYLDFVFDKEVEDSKICQTIGDLEIRNIFLDEEIKCPDVDEDEEFDIYGSRVLPSDLLEDGVDPEEDCT